MTASPFTARLPAGDQPVRWSGLHGSSRALALQAAARAHDGLILVVTRSSHQARILAQDLELLAPGGPEGATDILLFPDHETLPYDPFSPHPDIISERVAALARLVSMQRGLVLSSITALAQRLPPVDYVRQRAFNLVTGERVVIDAFRERLARAGYQSADQVHQPGQFAIRGSVIDLYPTGTTLPIRIDLFDEEIETIRLFDPETQRTTGQTDRIDLLPAREYPSDEEAFDAFRRAFRLRFDVDTRHVTLYQDLRAGHQPQGLEQYLPLFFETTSNLLDYPGAPLRLVVQEGALQAVADHYRRTAERWEQRRHDVERPVLDPQELFFTPQEVEARLPRSGAVELADSNAVPEDTDGDAGACFATRPAPELPIHEQGREAGTALKDFVAGFDGQVLFAADSAGRREVLNSTLSSLGMRPTVHEDYAAFHRSGAHIGLVILPVEDGFIAGDDLALLTESQLFGGRVRQRARREAGERDPEAIVRDLSDLQEGAPVVHEDHGVGRYQGLETLEIDGRPAEFLKLQYAGDDRLYVPVSYLHLISRYTGADLDSAPLHRLGGKQWEKARRKAAEKVRDVAAELLDLYARRQARPGFAFPLDDALYNEFAAGFPYEETPDQQQAIESVIGDLMSDQPMDRVVCGDVGFGKTEVALRAAFVAVQAGRQVAVLVPTTLLAQQHYSNFADRLADWPVKVELLSRFRGAKEIREALQRIEAGKVDIVIGTHRLLQRDVRFERLGLLVIDEEHRFGVQQKERLKQLRAEVDVLTLTATPIPRTLNMAMAGIRDLSIIATPPARRMAVKTLVSNWDKAVIREALGRELQRGGQVFFLHNEVRNIERIAREVGELAPSGRLAIAHGQMAEKELESVMLDFYRQRYNILVCTTIIESGIDVPTANTIVINRADRFGLAQLHQLRGRVGRSHHRAYAYLLVPDRRSMTADAKKRLEAIAALEDLGAGFTLATHDLEIRGAGELLGAEQSGQIHEIGFSLYSDMLNRAVDALRSGKEPDLDAPVHRGIDIELHVPALIPDDYLGDVPARLTLYKRIASAPDEAALRELQVEMIDRFGLLPQPVKNLFAVAELRLAADRIGLRRLDLGPGGGRIEFAEDSRADPQALIKLVQQESTRYRLEGPQLLRIRHGEEDPQKRMEQAATLLQRLTGSSQA
ncbi:transcription-repair coupling factor [Elongatibacter sediminis]|uniref:Transcription-repair-coupling factor n=1 Tax=Elongatibacter sediminis TaxID=3119006 RepID=A0AAW9RH46_9GAMM